MGNYVFQIIFSLSLSGTLIGILLFLMKPMIKNHFSKCWQYYIWSIVLLRLLLPITIESDLLNKVIQPVRDKIMVSETSLFSDISDYTGNRDINNNQPSVSNPFVYSESSPPLDDWSEPESKVPSFRSFAATNRSFSVLDYVIQNIGIIWLFGVVLLLTVKLVDYLGFIRYVKANNREITDERTLCIMDDVIMDLGLKQNVMLYENPLMLSPTLAGFFRPFIVLPVGITEKKELRYILTHELMHFKRKDIWYKWFCQIICCIHWFNPFLLLVKREIHYLCELSCDEAVICRYNEQERREYGNVLLTAADKGIKYRNTLFSTTLVENKKNLKERLKHIMNYKKKSKMAVFCSGIALCFVLAGATVAGAATLPDTKQENPKDSTSSKVSSMSWPWDNIADFWDDFNNYLEEKYGNWGNNQNKEVSDYWDDREDEWEYDWNDWENEWEYDWEYDWENKWKNNSKTIASMYNDDSLIAGEDVCNLKNFSYMRRQNNGFLQADRMNLNGSYTLVIDYVSAPVSVDVNYSFQVTSGKIKLVHIDPNNKVSVLAEGTKTGKKTVTLSKGRNCFKLVGDQADCGLSISFSDIDKKFLTAQYNSEWEEEEGKKLADIKSSGKVDINKLISYAKDLDCENVSNCIIELLQDNTAITSEQWKKLYPYADEYVISEYFSKQMKAGKVLSYDQLVSLLPILDEEFVSEYIIKDLTSSHKLTSTQLNKLLSYADEYTIGEYLLDFLKTDQNITLEQFNQLLPYTDEYVISDCMYYLIKNNNKNVSAFFQAALPYMDEGDIADCISYLIKNNNKDAAALFQMSLTYMDEGDIADCISYLIKYNNKDAAALFQMSLTYMDEEDIADCFCLLIKYNKVSFSSLFQSYIPYLDEDNIADCILTAIQYGYTFNKTDLKSYLYYMDEDDFVDIVDILLQKKQITSQDAKELYEAAKQTYYY